MQELIDRAKAILLKPVDTWPVIKSEAKTEKEIYTEYVMILAAVPIVAGFLGRSLFGYGMPFGRSITWMIVGYALSLAGVFVMAKIVDALAPTFEAQKSDINSLKLVAYSMTAMWVIGIVSIIPGLAWLQIFGLYSFYLFYVGLPHLMECPAEKTLVYTIVALVVSIVVWAVIGAILGSIVGISMMSYR